MIAELRGNLDEAIHFRESEIRKIFELHSMTFPNADGSPGRHAAAVLKLPRRVPAGFHGAFVAASP